MVEKLKQSALKGEVDLKKLYKMSSAESREFFTRYTDPELGKFLNIEWEKAKASKHRNAITDFVKSAYSPKEKAKPAYKNVLDKVKYLDELGVLSPKSEEAFLKDLVADKLGVSVSPQEVKIIAEKAKKIQEAQTKIGDDFGNPEKSQDHVQFFKAKKEMDDYLNGLTPANRLKVLTGTIGRGVMLASVKSPILNIGSNTELAITEALARRLASGQVRGTDNKMAMDYVKMVNKIYQETGYDLSRMQNISDTGASGSRVLGDTVHTQGPGAVRKIGRIVEDTVFKQLMGAPDVAFGAAHFADSVNLGAMKMAKGNKAEAKLIMRDAMQLEPKTLAGGQLREQAILDAQTATWTNDTWGSKVSLAIRKTLNEVSGDLRLGDQLMPFVKTPASVISTGVDYAGMGIPKALIDAVKAVRSGDLDNKQFQQTTSRNLVRAGLGLTAAAIIASQLNEDDFVGAYDPARAQIEQLRNSNTNSIRVGGKWISTDWLGPLAVPVTAMMYAKKYGNTEPEKAFQYTKGVGSAITNLPGISDIYDYVRTNVFKKNQTLNEMSDESFNSATGYLYSHLVPSFFSDVAKALDPYERQTQKGISSIKAKIPIIRETLPIKTDIFGEPVRGEGPISDIVFGSRVKTDKETALVKELNRVSNSVDKPINFTNWDKSSSATLGQFKQKFGTAVFDEAKVKYGQKLKTKIEETMAKPRYNSLPDEDKLKIINGLDAEVMKDVFREYRFHYQKPPAKKTRL